MTDRFSGINSGDIQFILTIKAKSRHRSVECRLSYQMECRIHYEERGRGDPLILIMGLGWVRQLDYDPGRIAGGGSRPQHGHC